VRDGSRAGKFAHRLVALALFAAGTPAPTQTTQSPPTPEARWHLKSIPGQCTLTGELTPGKVDLHIQAIPGTEYYLLAISGRDFGPQKPDETFPITILFHDKDARFDKYALSVPFPDGSGWLIRVGGLRADMLQALRRASSISLAQRGLDRPVRLPECRRGGSQARRLYCQAAHCLGRRPGAVRIGWREARGTQG
jgi:hypothetical protein